MKRKIHLDKIWGRPDCAGWAWHTKGRQYLFQNSNDLGLHSMDCDTMREMGLYETLVRKIKVEKGFYIYILKNKWGYVNEDGPTATLVTLKALMKDMHQCEMTDHERMLASRWWKNGFLSELKGKK